jgi:hypothetical protein
MKCRWSTYEARHPWRIAMLNGFALSPLLVMWWRTAEWFGLLFGIAVIGALVSARAIAWGQGGYARRNFIRRYGPLPEWPESRWLPERSAWPY